MLTASVYRLQGSQQENEYQLFPAKWHGGRTWEVSGITMAWARVLLLETRLGFFSSDVSSTPSIALPQTASKGAFWRRAKIARSQEYQATVPSLANIFRPFLKHPPETHFLTNIIKPLLTYPTVHSRRCNFRLGFENRQLPNATGAWLNTDCELQGCPWTPILLRDTTFSENCEFL